MTRPTVFLAGLLALGLGACTPGTTPLQSGGSGNPDNAMIGTAASYGDYSPYDVPGNGPGCAAWDQNCIFIYDAPGGGD